MVKLQRKTQKIFASNASTDQVVAFGTAQNNVPTYTKDINNIQNNNFQSGWNSAIAGDYAPYREDRNAVDYVTTSQLAYIYETGIPEYDVNTNYCLGADCKVIETSVSSDSPLYGTFSIYRSLIVDNKGNAVTNGSYWQLIYNSSWLTGTTSNIQAQLDNKQGSITGGASTITSSNLTANRVLQSNESGKVETSIVTNVELGYLSGVTSSVQTQLNSKVPSASLRYVQYLPANPDSNTYYFIPE